MEAVLEKINIEKYSSYKDSGVKWLGKIPSHWEAVSLGSLLELKSDKNHPGYEVLSVYREYGVIPKDSRDDNHNATSLDTTTYKAVEPGDLVVNKMKAWQGSMGISAYRGIVSPAYITCRVTSTKVHPEYLHLLLRSDSYIGEYNRISYGVRVGQWDMHYEDFKKVITLLPPKNEQTAIAAFLDRKTAQIDKAIALKEKQIELLKERRQILIHKAVTRGLNPDAPMKGSGVEWLGEIPAHWEVRRSKFLFTQRKERARENDVQLSATQAYGVIPQDEYESMIGRRVVKIQFHLDKRKHVEVDDFVISMRSFEGGLERAWSSGCIRSSYVVLRPLEKVDAGFYGYLFKSSKYIKALQTTADFIRDGQDLNFDNFSMVDLIVLPLEEQKEIAKYLDRQVLITNKAVALEQSQIEKLKEYKASLINSAVTGKIKVC